MVRVGGGWDTLDHFLLKHDPCRITCELTLMTNPCRCLCSQLVWSGLSMHALLVCDICPNPPLVWSRVSATLCQMGRLGQPLPVYILYRCPIQQA